MEQGICPTPIAALALH